MRKKRRRIFRQKNARFIYSDLYFLQQLMNSYGYFNQNLYTLSFLRIAVDRPIFLPEMEDPVFDLFTIVMMV